LLGLNEDAHGLLLFNHGGVALAPDARSMRAHSCTLVIGLESTGTRFLAREISKNAHAHKQGKRGKHRHPGGMMIGG